MTRLTTSSSSTKSSGTKILTDSYSSSFTTPTLKKMPSKMKTPPSPRKLPTPPAPRVESTLHFEDGHRKIDAILVYNTSKPSKERQTFITNLLSQGLQIEETPSVYKEDRFYVKIHAPDEVLRKFVHVFGFSVKYEQPNLIPEDIVLSRCCQTILTDPNPSPEHPDAKRAWESISREPPYTYTYEERSTIVFFIMQYVNFGMEGEPFKIGLNYLLMKKDFIAAFALHDGKWEWSANQQEPLNDRQLLARYWSSFATWNKEQPLYHIEQYFGPEIAMYFAWLGFYNKMLFIASIVGIVTFLYGFFHIFYVVNKPIHEACLSKVHICPVCKTCKPRELNYYCLFFHLAYLNDNGASMVFACFMSFWATLFIEFWKREGNTLVLKWHVNETEDENYRPQFQATVNTTRRHPYTQELELYVPTRTRCFKIAISVSVVFLMIFIVMATIFGVILYETAMKQMGMPPLFIVVSSSCFTLMAMVFYRWRYGSLAYSLTSMENPRTQLEFDKSYMIKMIIFSICNSYGKLIYVAFFKGKFFSYPGDASVRKSKFPLSSEVCDPTGCVVDIFILLGIIVVGKPLYSNIVECMTPIVKIWIKKMSKKRSKLFSTQLPSWEQDFELNPTNHFTIMEEVEEMVLQFGFITLLAAAFPLAPMCALVNNIFEIKIDSSKLVKYYRRGETVKSSSINVWFDTLQALTYLAVITNALYIAFTSNFIPEQVYFFNYKSDLSGYHLFQLSKFEVDDDYWPNTNITECLYVGQRYPPDDFNAYQKTYTFYYILSCRLGFSIVFLVIVFGCTAVLAYAVPDIPKKVKDFISYNQRKNLRSRMTRTFGRASVAVFNLDRARRISSSYSTNV